MTKTTIPRQLQTQPATPIEGNISANSFIAGISRSLCVKDVIAKRGANNLCAYGARKSEQMHQQIPFMRLPRR